jgi:SIR2-like domain
VSSTARETDGVDWESIVRRIKRGTCTPFLGAGASGDAIPLGSRIAQTWADEHSYPFADRWDLAQVAQFLAIKKDPVWPKEEIQELFGTYPPPDPAQADHPYAILARLPLPIYLTTNYDDFLARALRARGRKPVEEFCRWTNRPSFVGRAQVFDEPTFEPTVQSPLVYHLHGRIDLAESLVLTEDDYVDFLVNMAREAIVPPLISAVLAENMLLFLGYRLADWSFRVLYRGLMKTIDASGQRVSLTVQLEPQDLALVEAADGDPSRPPTEGEIASKKEAARQYLESYFKEMRVEVYWGTAQEFLAKLSERWAAADA